MGDTPGAAKKFINNPTDVVDEMIEGVLATSPWLCKVAGHNVLVRKDIESVRERQVTLISGGGSGHEPAHAGYVGEGMLSAAVLGGMFASPSVSAILAAIQTCTVRGAPGCLLIVKNYTGDRLNFGLAVEKARSEGLNVEMVVVADDCALPRDKGITGRRGVAGTVFVHKVAGAAAAVGLPLDSVHAEALSAAESVGTLGVALSTCTLPGQPVSNRLQGNKIEIGLGIHGEAGIRQIDHPVKADDLVDEMLTAITGGAQPYIAVSKDDQVCVLINNLGGTPTLELYICARRAIAQLRAAGAHVIRAYVGPFMTSLEMQGVSLSVLQVDPLMLARLDAVTSAPAWAHGSPLHAAPWTEIAPALPSVTAPQASSASVVADGEPASSTVTTIPRAIATDGTPLEAHGQLDRKKTEMMLAAMCAALESEEPNLTKWDLIAGDGDCGMTLKRGADAVASALFADKLPLHSGPALLTALADIVSESTGGTSGALIEVGLRAGASSLREGATWPEAFEAGVSAVKFYGGAEQGYRTMLDALLPAVDAVKEGDWAAAAAAAKRGADATADMASMAGRSNYVPREQLRGVPDPGAMAMAILLAAATQWSKYAEPQS
eukprot:m.204500 g.204500  ORF g.204500 m.204500 type:complete len:607 (-) comp22552_c0_seq1:145-1965(-)